MSVFFVVKEVAESIESTLPKVAPLGEPAFSETEPLGRNAARPDTPDFFGLHHAALLEHLKVLNDGSEGDG
jgi:hypothetical protein